MPREPVAKAILLSSLAAGLLLRGWAAFTDHGVYWPDEIYQSFEPAHWVVFGHGLRPWEFLSGARNWALPGLVAVVMKVCAVLGGDSPYVYVPVVKLVFALGAVAAGWGVYRLARVFGANELASAAAASGWALCAPAIYFGFRAMSENASAATVVWGLALVLDPKASRRLLLLGASLLGLSVMFRLQTGVFCAGVVLVLLARALVRTPRGEGQGPTRADALKRLGLVFAGLLLWAFLYGLTDALAWHDVPGAEAGGWFHSVVAYLRFNLSGAAGHWGTAAWTFYPRTLWSSMPLVTALTAVLLLPSVRRAPGLFLIAAAFFALHCMVPHKEYRFLVPMLPVAFALAGIGVAAVPRLLGERVAVPLLVAAAAASAITRGSLTFADLGSYPELPPQWSAWDDYGHVNRLMLVASRRADLCGLRIDVMHAGGVGLAWTGGSTYLHRRAPIYPPGYPAQPGYFNYVITGPGSGAEVIAKDNGIELVRIPNMSQCVPDQQYTWHLG